jgi:colicin import membrane protein
MSGDFSAPAMTIGNSAPDGPSQERLTRWLAISLIFHLVLIAALFVAPLLPSKTVPPAPIYTVDLVGGEKLGGTNLGTEFSGPPPKPAAKVAEPAPVEKSPPPAPEIKAEARKEKIEKPEKAPPKQKTAPAEDAIALKQTAKKEPVKKEPPKEPVKKESDAAAQEDSLERVRERLIQSAVERAKSRTAASEKASAARTEGSTPSPAAGQGSAPSKGEVYRAGPGEGEGAAALGPGGRGGGVVKGIEFISYRNRVLTTIRENWSWVPQRTDLKVTVHFGIKENGEIVGLKIVQPSGDRTYDESVLRALRKSTPLPPPPEAHRADFMDYTITFTPKDLGA